MKYRMIAFDLDYTLLDSKSLVSPENCDAVERAQQAGVLIVPCTGREWHTGKAIGLDHLPPVLSGVFKDGAIICDVATGQVSRPIVFADQLAHRILDAIDGLPVAILICRLASDGRCDYLVAGDGPAAARLEESWSRHAAGRVSVAKRPPRDDVNEVLEVRLYAPDAELIVAAQRMFDQFDEPLIVRMWPAALVSQDHVLQVYAPGVDKWPALVWLAAQNGIGPTQIAMIGDHVNDVSAIHAAGCGIAMGNAVDQARDAADRITYDCDSHGVAHAIDQLLTGRW